MTTRVLTAANRVANFSAEAEQKWKKQNSLRKIEEKYKSSQLHQDYLMEKFRNLELLANETIGPDDSANKVMQFHLDKMKDVEKIRDHVKTAEGERRQVRSQVSLKRA